MPVSKNVYGSLSKKDRETRVIDGSPLGVPYYARKTYGNYAANYYLYSQTDYGDLELLVETVVDAYLWNVYLRENEEAKTYRCLGGTNFSSKNPNKLHKLKEGYKKRVKKENLFLYDLDTDRISYYLSDPDDDTFSNKQNHYHKTDQWRNVVETIARACVSDDERDELEKRIHIKQDMVPGNRFDLAKYVFSRTHEFLYPGEDIGSHYIEPDVFDSYCRQFVPFWIYGFGNHRMMYHKFIQDGITRKKPRDPLFWQETQKALTESIHDGESFLEEYEAIKNNINTVHNSMIVVGE